METEEQVNSEASINDFPETETMPETYSVSDASSVKSGSDISISDADDDPPPPTDQIIEDPLPTNEVNEIKFSSSGSETSDAESETNGESEIPPTEELVASPTESKTSSSLSSPSKSPPVPKSKKAKKCAKNRSNNLLRTMRKGGMRKEKVCKFKPFLVSSTRTKIIFNFTNLNYIYEVSKYTYQHECVNEYLICYY